MYILFCFIYICQAIGMNRMTSLYDAYCSGQPARLSPQRPPPNCLWLLPQEGPTPNYPPIRGDVR